MKRILAAIFSIFVFFEATYALAVFQPASLGYINFSYSTMNVTGVTNSTAPTVGYPLWCTDCLANGGAGTLCVSTGTTKFNQFILSTGTACK